MGAGSNQLHIVEVIEPLDHSFRLSLPPDYYLATVGSGTSVKLVEQVEELSELFTVHNVDQLGAGYIGEVCRMATAEEVSFHFLVGIAVEVVCEGEVVAFYAEAIFGNIAALVKGYTVSFAELSGQLESKILLDSLTVVAVLGNIGFQFKHKFSPFTGIAVPFIYCN